MIKVEREKEQRGGLLEVEVVVVGWKIGTRYM